jgi:hypothetical protein
MMGQLERRTEVISEEFNPQEVANTLWAFATMGKQPGERMIAQLERRAEAISGEFIPQEVGNTLWASRSFFIHFNLSLRFCCFFSCWLPSQDCDDQKHLCQLHQVFISCDMMEDLHADLSESDYKD